MNPQLSKKFYSFVQALRKERVLECLNELERSQRYSPEELKELQWQKLKRLLAHAYENVPYYQKRFAETGIKPNDIVVPDDLLKIPILTKDDIRKYGSDMIVEDSKQKLIPYHSSGTTGEPLTLFFAKTHFAYSHAAQFRGFRWYGIDIGAKGGRLWGIPIEWKKRQAERLKDWFMNRKRLSAFELSENSMRAYFKQCQRFQPKYLYGYASALYTFARFLLENGIDGRSLHLKVIVCTSEVLHNYQKEIIEQAFGCCAVNEYGAAETGIIAFECPNRNIHIACENVYVEFMSNGEHVQPEQTGNIIVTNLNNMVMPIIRYEIGDIGKPSAESCPCGRGLTLIDTIEGRDNDVIITTDGGVIHGEIISYIVRVILKKGGGIKEIKVIQKELDKLLVLVVKDERFSSETETVLKEHIRKFVGEGMDITLEYVDRIPREASGKIRYVVSELADNQHLLQSIS